LHENSTKLVLGSIHFSDTKPSALAALTYLDPETSLALKKHIADYGGVPTEKEFGRLRRARENLALVGIQWTR